MLELREALEHIVDAARGLLERAEAAAVEAERGEVGASFVITACTLLLYSGTTAVTCSANRGNSITTRTFHAEIARTVRYYNRFGAAVFYHTSTTSHICVV